MSIEGLDSLIRKMQGAPAKVAAAGAGVARRRAEQMADTARRLVPRDKGALAESVRVDQQDDGTALVTAGSTEATARQGNNGFSGDEALIVEYGTTERARHPFFRPAFEDVRIGFGREIEREIQSKKE